LVELPDPSDYEEISAPSGGASDTLEILGLGTAVLDDYAPDFFGEVEIRSAQLALSGDGRLDNASSFTITNGGTLFLDNSGTAHADRISNTAWIYLYAGTLAFDPGDFGFLSQETWVIDLGSGANQIDLHLGSAAGGQLLAETLTHAANATLNLRYIDPTGGSAPTNVHFAVKDQDDLDYASTGGILPWATITQANGSQVDWVEWEEGVSTVFNPLTNYHTGDPADWLGEHNVLIDGGTATLPDLGEWGWLSINSLKLANDGVLDLGDNDTMMLDLGSGGLLSTGANDQIQGAGYLSSFGLDFMNKPLYVHVHGSSLTVGGAVILSVGSRSAIVKTGAGTLRLNGDGVTMSGRELVINQGTVAFEQGEGMSFERVVVGDGTGTDVLELPANHTNPIQHPSSRRRPDIILHGTPYSTNPDSGEFDAAILRFGGGTVQNAYSIHVEGRGTLDFVGGTESAPNMLFLEEFTLADFETTMLFIRNWEDKHDVLLVRHNAPNIARIDADFLARINFEGYGDAQWVYWSDEYWEIRPLNNDPEPATTGAILGAVGLGLVIWRRRKRRSAQEGRRPVFCAEPSPIGHSSA